MNNSAPLFFKVTIKIIISILLIIFIILSLKFLLFAVVEHNEFNQYMDIGDNADHVNVCDNCYYNGEYGVLYDTLCLYDMYGEKYNQYWEIVNGYIDYEDYLMYHNAGNEEKASELKAKVLDNFNNCNYNDNKRILEKYKNAIE